MLGRFLGAFPWFTVAACFALAVAAFPLFLLYHDVMRLEGGPLDDLFHLAYAAQFVLIIPYCGALLVLLHRLACGVGSSARRAFTLGAVWSAIGLVAFAVVATYSHAVQDLVNIDAYKRVTPDDFRTLIGTFIEPTANPLDILDHPEAFDSYSWASMTLRETAAIVAMGFGAAFTILAANRWARPLRAFAAPLVLYAMAFAYSFRIAPWAFILDYDVFVGDRILGGWIANSVFLDTGDLPSALAVSACIVSIIFLAVRWSPRTDQV